MEQSVLFFDIDGTLLSEVTGQIPQSAIDAIRRAQKAGHLLFVNTGRTICAVTSDIHRIGFDGILCGCGTYLQYGDEVLFSRSVEEKRGRELIAKLTECNLCAVAEGIEDVYFPERMVRFDGLESTRRYFKAMGMGIEQPLERGRFTYDKLYIYRDGQSDWESFVEFVKEDMDVIDRGRGTYEVVQKGYSKATACEFIMDYFKIPRERSFAFGDSSNDLDMFRYAAHSIAMGKHAEVLDPYTEFVTKTVEEDGIAYAMKHYGLLEP